MEREAASPPPSLQIWVNGEEVKLCASRSVTDLVAELRLVPSTVLIEVNGSAPVRSEWPAITLAPGDRIEILRVAAGG
jgi:thiamine biosynthesis protein ThiS